MKKLLLLFLLFTSPVLAVDFDIKFEPDIQGNIIPQVYTGNLAPSFIEDVTDGDFFFYINTEAYDAAPSQASCYGPIVDTADCYSVTSWADRMLDGLLLYDPFIDWLQDLVDIAFVDPILDEQLVVPLLGEWNIGLHIHDIWNDEGCGNPASGPVLLKDNNKRIGCAFSDDDDKGVDVREFLAVGKYISHFYVNGIHNGSQLPQGQMSDGDITIYLELLSPVFFDVIMRQPDFPAQATSGYYTHAAGQLGLDNVSITISLNSVGGNLRTIAFADDRSTGSSIGLSLRYLRLQGSATLDADGFDCTYNSWCDATKLNPSHPDYNDQANYERKTNAINETLIDAIRYIEAHMVYEAQRAVSGAEEYLTALELLDLYDITHTLTPSRYEPPTLDHPFGGAVTIDYGFFYRWDADQDESILLLGGAGFEMEYEYSADCNQSVPFPPRYPTVGYPDLTPNSAKDTRYSMVGAGIHINALNRTLDKLYENNALCFRMTPDSPVLGDAANVLNTDAFSAFLPRLREGYLGKDMMVIFKPKYLAGNNPPATFDPVKDQPLIYINNPDNPYDLTLKLPHIEMEFYIKDESHLTKLFGIEVTAEVDFGLGVWIANPSLPNFPNQLIGTACGLPPYPCRVFRLNGKVRSQVYQINQYNFSDVLKGDDLQASISQFLTLILNGVVEGRLEIYSDLRDVLGFTIDPSTQFPALAITDPAYYGTVLEPVDIDDDGVYEYIGLYASVSDVYPEDGEMDIIAPWVTFGLVQDGLAPAYHTSLETFWDLPFYYGKKTYLTEWQTQQLGLYDGISLHVTSLGQAVIYQYQIDNGMYQNSYDGAITGTKQFYGHHIIKVWGVDEHGILEVEPAILEYDLVPPPIEEPEKVIVLGCGVTGNKADVFILILVVFLLSLVFRKMLK